LQKRESAAALEDEASVTSSAVFDEQLVPERTEGTLEVCDLLVKTFLKECPARLASLRQELQKQDSKALAAEAHGLKGAIANFTSGAALEEIKQLEALAKRGDLRACDQALRRVTQELDELQTALSEFIANKV
jgi:HPt (histidine-containing phosphotransfer) domain-containing protein